MKNKIDSGLLVCAVVLAVAAAIFLPPYLSRLADRRLESAEYSVQAETLDVSLVYTMSTVERLALLAQKNWQCMQDVNSIVNSIESSEDASMDEELLTRLAEAQRILTIDNTQPAQDELTAAQASALAQEELDRLFALGAFPTRIQFGDLEGMIEIYPDYKLLYNRDSRQQSLSLWNLTMMRALKDGPVVTCASLDMDAETGLLYSLDFDEIMEKIDLKALASAWGVYLALGTSEDQELISTPPTPMTDVYGHTYTTVGEDTLVVTYHTDAGEILYSFNQRYASVGSFSISLSVTPLPAGWNPAE